jgi:hypothetical protein
MATVRTDIGNSFGKVAVVAFQMPMLPMQRHSHRAVGTEVRLAAAFTVKVFEIPPGRQKKQRLIPCFKIFIEYIEYGGVDINTGPNQAMIKYVLSNQPIIIQFLLLVKHTFLPERNDLIERTCWPDYSFPLESVTPALIIL